MREQLEKRLTDLKTEFEAGQKMLADLEKKRAELEMKRTEIETTMLRISGAIQVVEEVLAKDQQQEQEPVE